MKLHAAQLPEAEVAQTASAVVVPPPENLSRVLAASTGSVAVSVTDGSTVMPCETPLQRALVGESEFPLLSERATVACAPELSMVHVRGTVTVPGKQTMTTSYSGPDPTPVSLIVPVVETPAGQSARTAVCR